MVGISLLTLVPGVVGGSETYVRELCRALARVGELEYRVFAPSLAPEAGAPLPSTTVGSYRASRSTPGRVAAMTRAALLPRALRRELRLDELEAIHFPLSVMLPPVARPPAVTTMHDLQHEAFPDFFSRGELAYRRLVYRRTARASRLLVAPSAFVARTLAERFDLAPDRVRAIHHGIDHERFRPDGRARGDFLLYPANRWPHKNHERLFEALALLRRSRPGLTLVLTGSGHEGRRVPAGVEVRGHVPPAELADLYRSAAALVFPSLYEGFGAPPLEAMACGCPVAASGATALPEVVGDAAVLFDPASPEAIAEGVERALGDPALPARGLERAAGFTWEASARAHEAAYRELGA